MNTQVAVNLSEQVYRQARRLAQLTSREVNELLAEAITHYLSPVSPLGENIKPISELPDREVLKLTELEMPRAQDRRLSRLLDRQQAGSIRENERAELLALMQVYQEGLLRKAQALNEAVRRGLVKPLKP